MHVNNRDKSGGTGQGLPTPNSWDEDEEEGTKMGRHILFNKGNKFISINILLTKSALVERFVE